MAKLEVNDEIARAKAQAFSLEIAGQTFENWSEIEFEQSIDGFSTVGFTAPFEPEREEFRDLFRPFSYEKVKVFAGRDLVGNERGKLLFTGRLVNVVPKLDGGERKVVVQCTALPTVLEDCCAPPELGNQTEFNGLYLLAIAQTLCAPHGFTALFADERSQLVDVGNGLTSDLQGESFDVNARKKRDELAKAFANKFGRVKIESGQKIHDFLQELAKQRGVVMRDNAEGDLVFVRSVATGYARSHLEQGLPPLLSVTPQFDCSEYYSEVTVVVPTTKRRKGGSYTVANPFCNTRRPCTIKAESCDVPEAHDAARHALGRMFGNAVSWDVELPVLVDAAGEFYRPNTTITIKAPDAMIYGRHELLIRSVNMRQDSQSTSCSLNLVLPGAFSGELPAALPWNEAL
jgi:prophage tail gpP-like protein